MCTSLTIFTKNNKSLLGRTMDFPSKGIWDPVVVIQPTYEMSFGQKRPIKYPYVGGGRRFPANHFLVADGINVEGLACAELMFPLKANYLDNKVPGKLNMAPQDFIHWVLSEHKSVSEVRQDMKNIVMVAKSWLYENKVSYLHWTLTDRTGDSMIVEPTIPADPQIYNNSLGVMTNSPTFPEHQANFRNYPKVGGSLQNQVKRAKELYSKNDVMKATNVPTTRFIHAATLKLAEGTQRTRMREKMNYLTF